MRNIVNINLAKEFCWGTANVTKCDNSIILIIQLLDTIDTQNVQLEFIDPSGAVTLTDIIDVNLDTNNNQIVYEIPSDLYVKQGTLKVRVISTDYESDYITFKIQTDLSGNNDINVKYDSSSKIFIVDCSVLKPKNEIYPVGTVYVSDSNKNPGTVLGGKWQLIDKGFRALSKELVQGEDYTINETNCDAKTEVAYTRTGNTLYIRITLVNKVKITDSSLSMLTLNLNKIGVSQFAWSRSQILGGSDGGEGIVNASLNYKSGEFSTQDVCLNNDGGTEMEIEKTTVFHITIPVIYTFMLDSACDKFYWKRTA